MKEKRSTVRKEKIKSRIGKRPANAYMEFCKEQRPKLVAKGLSAVEIAKECGRLWRALSPSYKREKLAHAEKVRGAYKQKRQQVDRQLRKGVKTSSYTKFVKEHIAAARQKADGDAKKAFKIVAQMWREQKEGGATQVGGGAEGRTTKPNPLGKLKGALKD